jgi:hypothetical protein
LCVCFHSHTNAALPFFCFVLFCFALLTHYDDGCWRNRKNSTKWWLYFRKLFSANFLLLLLCCAFFAAVDVVVVEMEGFVELNSLLVLLLLLSCFFFEQQKKNGFSLKMTTRFFCAFHLNGNELSVKKSFFLCWNCFLYAPISCLSHELLLPLLKYHFVRIWLDMNPISTFCWIFSFHFVRYFFSCSF